MKLKRRHYRWLAAGPGIIVFLFVLVIVLASVHTLKGAFEGLMILLVLAAFLALGTWVYYKAIITGQRIRNHLDNHLDPLE